MPAPDCLQCPPYGQWLTNSISLLSHFPVLLLICHPQVRQIKVWQRWQRTPLKTGCSIILRKAPELNRKPKQTFSRSIALYWFFFLLVFHHYTQTQRICRRELEKKKYETWKEWGWVVGEGRDKVKKGMKRKVAGIVRLLLIIQHNERHKKRWRKKQKGSQICVKNWTTKEKAVDREEKWDSDAEANTQGQQMVDVSLMWRSCSQSKGLSFGSTHACVHTHMVAHTQAETWEHKQKQILAHCV